MRGLLLCGLLIFASFGWTVSFGWTEDDVWAAEMKLDELRDSVLDQVSKCTWASSERMWTRVGRRAEEVWEQQTRH